MIDERREERAALYALDLLEGDEHASFETELAADPSLGTLVADFRHAAAALSHAAPGTPPPDDLRHRVLASAAASRAARRPATRLAFSTLAPWAAAACFAGLAAWLGEQYLVRQSEAVLLQDQLAAADLALRSARNESSAAQLIARHQLDQLNERLSASSRLADQARSRSQELDLALAAARRRVTDLQQELKTRGDLADFKITLLASLLKNSPQALAIAVWDPTRHEGVLTVEKLPAPAANEDYQLWVVDPQYPDPVDGGVFTVDRQSGAARVKFTGRQPVAAISAFAVTLERKGGVAKAEGPFVLLGR